MIDNIDNLKEPPYRITITSTSDWLQVTIFKKAGVPMGAWAIDPPIFVSSKLFMERLDISTETVHWKGVSAGKENALTVIISLNTTADNVWFSIRKGGLGNVVVASKVDSCTHAEWTSEPRDFNIALTKPAAERLRVVAAATT